MPLTDSDTGSESEGDVTYKPTSKVEMSELSNRNKTPCIYWLVYFEKVFYVLYDHESINLENENN